MVSEPILTRFVESIMLLPLNHLQISSMICTPYIYARTTCRHTYQGAEQQ